MTLTIFGGTGRTGKYLVRKALDAGYDVRVLVRTPSKVDLRHERLTLIQGDIQDPAAVDRAVAGTDAVISVLGPTQNQPDYQVSKGIRNIIDAMKRHGVRRLIVSVGAGVGAEGDTPKLVNRLITVLVKVVSKHVYEDMWRMAEKVRASGLDWTLVRVPMLTNEPSKGNVRVGMVGKGTGPRLSREDMAEFMLKQVANKAYLDKSPVISN